MLGFELMNRPAPEYLRGFTLIELLVTVVVLSVVLSLAVPALQETIKNNRVTAQNNELMSLINLAKSHAVRRNENVLLELFSDGFEWRANVRLEGDVDDDLDSGCPEIPGVIRCVANRQVSLDADPLVLTFNNRGYLDQASGDWDAADLFLEHDSCNGAFQARHIRILPTGQISSEAIDCP